MSNILPSSNGYPDIVVTRSLMGLMAKFEKGHTCRIYTEFYEN